MSDISTTKDGWQYTEETNCELVIEYKYNTYDKHTRAIERVAIINVYFLVSGIKIPATLNWLNEHIEDLREEIAEKMED
jgi:hypothetical protein